MTASAPNNAASKTEILVARMPSADRAPREEDYVTHSFVKFTSGAGLSTVLNLGVGRWAVAAKFVCPETGEEKGLRPLGTFTISLAVMRGGLDEEKPAARAKKAA